MHVYCSRAPTGKYCVSWTLEGSPRYRGGSCAICTGQASNAKSAKYEENVCCLT